jgi:hypothetical protein
MRTFITIAAFVLSFAAMAQTIIMPVGPPRPFTGFYHFGRDVTGAMTNEAQNIQSGWHIHLGGTMEFEGTGNLELRGLRTDPHGNRYVWLTGYQHSDGARFPLKAIKSVIQLDDGREFDVTEPDVEGIPYALQDATSGYRIKSWHMAIDESGKYGLPGQAIRLFYWEQHYTNAVVYNPVRDQSKYCVEQRQGSWVAHIIGGVLQPGKWALWTDKAGGNMGDIDVPGIGTVIMPNGENTVLTWYSAHAMGHGFGWKSITEHGELYNLDVMIN